MSQVEGPPAAPAGRLRRGAALAVHLYTSLGLVCALLASRAVLADDAPQVFFWLIIAFLIDASDGVLARLSRAKEVLPTVDGRKLDDIIDYLNYTFVPLLLVGRAGWLPEPAWAWVSLALVASAFAFSNAAAKEEGRGFFLGFPSYWNVFAFYTAVSFRFLGEHFVALLLLLLSLLSVAPVRFVYPSHAPRWKTLYVIGGLIWLVLVSMSLWEYWMAGEVGSFLVGASLAYPVFYIVSSIYLDVTFRRNPS